MTMTLSGSGTIGGLVAGGLPDATITSAELAAGAPSRSQLPAGTVLQVVQKQNIGSANTYSATSSSTYADMMNMSMTITPTASTSKILVISVGGGMFVGTGTNLGLKLLRNGSAVWTQERFGYVDTNAWTPVNYSTHTLDSPATTSPVTYKFQFCVSGGSNTGLRIGDTNGTLTDSYTAVILMEIAA